MPELVAEFSSSAYLTDTQLSRFKRIPGHTVAVAVSNVTDNRFEPTIQRSRYPLQRLVDTLTRSLYQFHKRLSGGFFIFTIAPCPQALHPVDRFAQLRKAPAPLVTGDQLVHV